MNERALDKYVGFLIGSGYYPIISDSLICFTDASRRDTFRPCLQSFERVHTSLDKYIYPSANAMNRSNPINHDQVNDGPSA